MQKVKFTVQQPEAIPEPKQKPQPSIKKASTKAATLSCDKAQTIVGSYGFSDVAPVHCAGKVFAFGASRDGKRFVVELDAQSGELTEVRKAP